MDIHPLGTRARVLLCSVFGPYAQYDRFGSRKDNLMELFHNQITLAEGPFSIRSFYPTIALQFIQENIDAPCTVLDYPTLNRFILELQQHRYDIIGITANTTNILKVKHMCELIRKYQPNTKIVIGGYISLKENLKNIIDTDYIIQGDGISWFQEYLGMQKRKIRHPTAYTNTRTVLFGKERKPRLESCVVPTLGCVKGCDFCSTSAMFGGKGRCLNVCHTGDELFSVMEHLEKTLHVHSFTIFDENFLINKRRALRLLQLMEQHNKTWSLFAFSSADAIRTYQIDELIKIGINTLWIGIESKDSAYTKLHNSDTISLVHELQSHGIKVICSSIIGLPHHTLENIDEHIAWSVAHDASAHQYTLFSAFDGTPLYHALKKEGMILPEEALPSGARHALYRFSFHHKNISEGKETELLGRAFKKELAINGPTIVKMIQTDLSGWLHYHHSKNERIRNFFRYTVANKSRVCAGILWAAQKWYKREPYMRRKIGKVLKGYYDAFGWNIRISTPFIGEKIYLDLIREDKRLKRGITYEPPTIYIRNKKASGYS